MYRIEDGIPVPSPKTGGGCPPGPRTDLTKALWALTPSQSFLVETFEEYKRCLSYFARMPEKRFVTRKVDRQGWRIWRLN